MIRASLLSLSDKSTGDVFGNVDVDYATGSFCSSCSIPPPAAGGLWCLKGVQGGDLIIFSRKIGRDVPVGAANLSWL